jgi:hypothetical protein
MSQTQSSHLQSNNNSKIIYGVIISCDFVRTCNEGRVEPSSKLAPFGNCLCYSISHLFFTRRFQQWTKQVLEERQTKRNKMKKGVNLSWECRHQSQKQLHIYTFVPWPIQHYIYFLFLFFSEMLKISKIYFFQIKIYCEGKY